MVPEVVYTPRLARSIEVLRQQGLTPTQRDARMGLAGRLADFRHAMENHGNIWQAGKELLDAMEQADFADRRALGEWS